MNLMISSVIFSTDFTEVSIPKGLLNGNLCLLSKRILMLLNGCV